MSTTLSERLVEALSELEASIVKARSSLSRLPNPQPDLEERLKCYEEVLRRQKQLAQDLVRHVQTKNWEEVKRFGDLIRGSSYMIQLDAHALAKQIIEGAAQNDSEQYQA